MDPEPDEKQEKQGVTHAPAAIPAAEVKGITGIPPTPDALPKNHPSAKLMNAAYAAWHLCMSLLACREGATDHLIEGCRDALGDAMIHTALMTHATPSAWQPIATAPRDGTWILGVNNRGNQAVIIWSESARTPFGELRPGWIHPFSSGALSSFWNGGCGSVPTHWMPLPAPPEV